jgi:addiction module HigA family antidote
MDAVLSPTVRSAEPLNTGPWWRCHAGHAGSARPFREQAGVARDAAQGGIGPMKNPPHPREIIREEVIRPHGLSVTAAAAALGVTRQALSAFLNERSDRSPEMALRIGSNSGRRRT